MLDAPIVEHFKAAAGERGYQSLINDALRRVVEGESFVADMRLANIDLVVNGKRHRAQAEDRMLLSESCAARSGSPAPTWAATLPARRLHRAPERHAG